MKKTVFLLTTTFFTAFSGLYTYGTDVVMPLGNFDGLMRGHADMYHEVYDQRLSGALHGVAQRTNASSVLADEAKVFAAMACAATVQTAVQAAALSVFIQNISKVMNQIEENKKALEHLRIQEQEAKQKEEQQRQALIKEQERLVQEQAEKDKQAREKSESQEPNPQEPNTLPVQEDANEEFDVAQRMAQEAQAENERLLQERLAAQERLNRQQRQNNVRDNIIQLTAQARELGIDVGQLQRLLAAGNTIEGLRRQKAEREAEAARVAQVERDRVAAARQAEIAAEQARQAAARQAEIAAEQARQAAARAQADQVRQNRDWLRAHPGNIVPTLPNADIEILPDAALQNRITLQDRLTKAYLNNNMQVAQDLGVNIEGLDRDAAYNALRVVKTEVERRAQAEQDRIRLEAARVAQIERDRVAGVGMAAELARQRAANQGRYERVKNGVLAFNDYHDTLERIRLDVARHVRQDPSPQAGVETIAANKAFWHKIALKAEEHQAVNHDKPLEIQKYFNIVKLLTENQAIVLRDGDGLDVDNIQWGYTGQNKFFSYNGVEYNGGAINRGRPYQANGRVEYDPVTTNWNTGSLGRDLKRLALKVGLTEKDMTEFAVDNIRINGGVRRVETPAGNCIDQWFSKLMDSKPAQTAQGKKFIRKRVQKVINFLTSLDNGQPGNLRKIKAIIKDSIIYHSKACVDAALTGLEVAEINVKISQSETVQQALGAVIEKCKKDIIETIVDRTYDESVEEYLYLGKVFNEYLSLGLASTEMSFAYVGARKSFDEALEAFLFHIDYDKVIDRLIAEPIWEEVVERFTPGYREIKRQASAERDQESEALDALFQNDNTIPYQDRAEEIERKYANKTIKRFTKEIFDREFLMVGSKYNAFTDAQMAVMENILGVPLAHPAVNQPVHHVVNQVEVDRLRREFQEADGEVVAIMVGLMNAGVGYEADQDYLRAMENRTRLENQLRIAQGH